MLKYKLLDKSLNDKNNIIKTILINRGINDLERYLNLDVSCCNSYDNLDNINDAVKLFDKHFSQRNPIAILVDEDVDGQCSSACMYSYIKLLDDTYPVYYILHSNNKVHGLTKMNDGDFVIPEDVKLFIIPDAGTNDVEQMNKLVECGIDCLCLDHHQREREDKCFGIIVNNQISDKYTDKNFCGTGIIYEFLRALDDWYICSFADKFLDLVCFANIADVMSIKDFQTRYYINQGFKNIKNKFLLAMMDAQRFSTNGVWNIFNVAWYLVPPINSLIRIGSLEDKDKLFRAFVEQDATFVYKKRGSSEEIEEDIYTHVARLCKNTKSRQDRMRDSLCEELKEQVNPNDKVAVLVATDADAGIVGLSTMRLAEWASKPCIVLREYENGVLGGSARNYNNSPIKDFKEVVNSVGLFNFAQGHSNAFGCEISSDKLDAAREALNKALSNYEYDDTIYCDFILDAYDMDYEFIKTIDDYKWVWGQQVEEPIVAIENIEISTDDCIVMSKNQDTVAFMYGGVKYCKFKCSEDDELLMFARGLSDEYATLNVVGKCSINEYKGNYTAQVIIDDYEFTI